MDQRQRVRLVQSAVGKIQKKLRKLRFPCLYPGCTKLAVSSHSQQKEGQLRAIAKNGIVYTLKRNMFSYTKCLTKGKMMTPLSKVGIREASAFPGYCADHDREVFAPIERRPLAQGDAEQASLFFLRAASFEYAAKRAAAIQLEVLANVVKADTDPQWQEFSSMWSQGIKLFLVREGPFILGQIFDIIAKRNYGRLHTSWARVTETLPVSLATSVCPWLDDYYDKWSPAKPQAMVSFSIIPGPSYSDIVSSWLGYCHADSVWIQEQMGTLEGVERLVNLLGIAESEDLCMNVDFWESTPDQTKEFILSNMLHDALRGPLGEVPLVVKFKKETELGGPANWRGRAPASG